jgi:hypothetical protein
MMVKTLSMPMDTPTQGVCVPEGENMPTRLSYRPPSKNYKDREKKLLLADCGDGIKSTRMNDIIGDIQ